MTEPTVPNELERMFDAVGKVAGTIAGIQAVFAGGRAGIEPVTGAPVIQPMIDEELIEENTPAAVLYHGDWTVLAGSWEQQKHEAQLLLWIPAQPVANAYAEAIAFPWRVMEAFPARAKAFEIDPLLQSVLVTGGGGIEARAWPEGSERRFLVRSVSLELAIRRAAQYQPR